MRELNELTIRVAIPDIDGLKVQHVTAVDSDGVMYVLDVLSVTRPVKLTPRKDSPFRLLKKE